MHWWRPRLVLAAIVPLIAGTLFVGLPFIQAAAYLPHRTIDCQYDARCLEVQDWKDAGFEYYVGHDEPSMLFYSNRPGSGNSSNYQLTLPTDPATAPNASGSSPVTWNFQLHPAFWFGMILCNRDSWPNVTKDCAPDSDSNIKPLAQAAGQAFLELQFYPPGWFPISCTAKRWCVAMVIWSLAEDPINGTVLNSSCTSQIGGLEYPNLAFLTKSGVPAGPPNPIQLNSASFAVTNDFLLMNQGDKVTVSIHDTANGLQTVVKDLTTNTTGSMVASAKNGFGTVDYQPTGSACNLVPYDFHPEYSTSQPPGMVPCPTGVYPNPSTAAVCTDQGGTRVQWAAHSYNVSFSDEIGHWDWCSSIVEPAGFGSGHCGISGKEGPGLTQHDDGDSGSGCYTGAEGANFALGGSVAASDGSGAAVPGCISSNDGFDGGPYLADRWAPAPNAPSPITFSSPTFGNGHHPYQQAAFEADIPRITALTVTDWDCSRNTGTRFVKDPVTGNFTNTGQPCAVPPNRDTGAPGFYPTFGQTGTGESCMWRFGNFANSTTQYGQALFKLAYLTFGGQGAIQYRFNDVRSSFISSGCGLGGEDAGGGGGNAGNS